MSSKVSTQALIFCRDFSEFFRVLSIGEELDTVLFKKRNFRGEGAGLFVLLRQVSGCDLAGFNVRLVESIDTNDRAGYGGCNFPTEEIPAQAIEIPDRNSNYPVAAAPHRAEFGVC